MSWTVYQPKVGREGREREGEKGETLYSSWLSCLLWAGMCAFVHLQVSACSYSVHVWTYSIFNIFIWPNLFKWSSYFTAMTLKLKTHPLERESGGIGLTSNCYSNCSSGVSALRMTSLHFETAHTHTQWKNLLASVIVIFLDAGMKGLIWIWFAWKHFLHNSFSVPMRVQLSDWALSKKKRRRFFISVKSFLV